MNGTIIIITLLLLEFSAFGQHTLAGQFKNHSGTQIKLIGFKGLISFVLDSTKTSENGEFSLKYPESYRGMGILDAGSQQKHVVILEPGGVHLTGTYLAEKDSLQVKTGSENNWFIRYAGEHQLRERMLSGWIQMQNIYIGDTLLNSHKTPIQHISQEIMRIKAEDSLYIANLPNESYCKWYLPYRSLISSVQAVAMYRSDEVPTVIQKFREIDYTDSRWQTSGLMKEAIEAHVWLIENSAGHLDSVFSELNKSTDVVIEKLKDHPEILNSVSEHMFIYLEQRSLFTASEYLSLQMLNNERCDLDTGLSKMMESYRAMKKGNIASDIVFSGDVVLATSIDGNAPKKLSELNSKYKVVIFGSSWCPHCPKQLKEATEYYATWKQQGVEVVLISLDDDKKAFEAFTQAYPFISMCDYQKWESKAVKDYHVFATPTIYLLNKEHEIILKPQSVKQLNAWIDWHLAKGNNIAP